MQNKGYSVYLHLGPIPNDWHVVNAQDICTKITDGTHDTPSPTKHGVPYIKSVHIKKGTIRFDDCLFLCQEDHDIIFKRCNPAKGDLLIVNIGIGNIGHCAYVDVDFEFSMKNIALLKPDPKLINDRYLYHYYKSRQQKVTHSTKTGGAQPFLSLRDLKKLKIVVPPILEQCKISQILSTWDKAISTTESLIANSQQQKKSLTQQLLTGKKRFTEFGDEWSLVRLGSLLIEGKERNKSNTISRVLSVTNHSGFVLPEEQFSKRVASKNVTNYKVVRKGQFGYNPSRINVGSFARLDFYDVGLLSPMYVIFSVNESQLNSDYFMNWMSSNEAKQRILGSTQGSVRDSVGFDALSSFPFKLPSFPEQQKIASVLTAADQEIDTLQQKLSHLKQEKKALMQQLLTGKRRVIVDNEMEAA